ncbi:MAG: peptide chain release factor N(5)-glutamine methyltransferase [Lachnospiraceae bacterium]|nr:peptide chain release factor N(5)-glutamine methyltransferase [Lachnospiraceae bacterium]
MTYRELYDKGVECLKKVGIEEAPLDARLLLEAVCHTNRNDLLVHGDKAVESAWEQRYLDWIEQRADRIPLQQLTGKQEFMGLEFVVNEHVLIPRQDTEILVEEVLKNLHDGMRILDMCTGSGCILISLLHYSNHCMGVGVDISAEALQVAKENARRLLDASAIQDDERKLRFVESNLFEGVECGKYEFIVSNPPYIPSAVCDTLMPEVREHEPRIALDGSADGLYFYRRIIEAAPDYLVSGGKLFFEIGYDQAEAVKRLMQDAGFREVCVVKDYAGLDRVVYGTYIVEK